MNPIVVGLITLVAFGGGMLTSHIIWVYRMTSTERLQKMLDAARRQGQVERERARGNGLEPPKWLP